MTAILIRLAPYLLAAAAVFSGGWYAGGLVPKAALGHLQAADDHTRAMQAETALRAVQGQLVQAQTVSANNAQTVESLNAQNAQIAADRDRNVELARRLLLSAHRPAAPGHQLPETPDHPGPVTAGPAPADGSVANLLAGVAAECDANAAQLDALIAEVKPQI